MPDIEAKIRIDSPFLLSACECSTITAILETQSLFPLLFKWDLEYQKKWGIRTGLVKDMPNGAVERITRICKRTYRALCLSGYARMDLRLTSDGTVYVLEANPNPQLAYGEDFAESAHRVGLDYERLLTRILQLGLSYRARGLA